MSGRRAKAEGRLPDGSIGEKKIVGNGQRIYGYKYMCDEKGKKVGITPNHGVILIELDGTRTRVLIDQLGAVDRELRLGDLAGRLDPEEMDEVDQALRLVLGML